MVNSKNQSFVYSQFKMALKSTHCFTKNVHFKPIPGGSENTTIAQDFQFYSFELYNWILLTRRLRKQFSFSWKQASYLGLLVAPKSDIFVHFLGFTNLKCQNGHYCHSHHHVFSVPSLRFYVIVLDLVHWVSSLDTLTLIPKGKCCVICLSGYPCQWSHVEIYTCQDRLPSKDVLTSIAHLVTFNKSKHIHRSKYCLSCSSSISWRTII